ncbi:hypothetical protein [Faecalibacter bovis]|uniref:Transmembrane protein n=1 Tax=Faecalibacter bovis TaxID=2898187 RepID=A0ABX7XAV4_9FLAO|nr:hypothetical protein [Faecalibacter bovis]QTV04985.1 hypothetical protein J9309_09310 [Faecalibacter bovis]
MKSLYIIFLSIFIFFGCLDANVNGIIINDSLLSQQSYNKNQTLKKIIIRCLNQESSAFKDLQSFECGGAAGCYNLGYILTQIIFKIGEDNYIKTTSQLPHQIQEYLKAFIRVGLEYGDNNYDGVMDNLRIKSTFPKIDQINLQ